MSPRSGLDLQAVLHAAAEIADRQGLEAVTLAALAKKLDIRSPSLYNHIDGLDGLRKKLAVYGLEMLFAELIQSGAGRSGDEKVRALSKAYLTFARTHPGVYAATLRAPDPEDDEAIRIAEKIVGLILQLLQAYGLEDDAALHAVRGLRSLLHGFAALEQAGAFGLSLDLDESFRRLIDTFIAGIPSAHHGGKL